MFTKEDCLKFLSKHTKSTGKLISYTLTPWHTIKGFGADYKHLNIVYFLDGDKKEYLDSSFFVKVANQNNLLNNEQKFDKEALIYKHFLNHFIDGSFPKCYLVDMDRNIIVLENLSSKGFSNSEGLNAKQMEGVIKSLAQFHAASIIFEECILDKQDQ